MVTVLGALSSAPSRTTSVATQLPTRSGTKVLVSVAVLLGVAALPAGPLSARLKLRGSPLASLLAPPLRATVRPGTAPRSLPARATGATLPGAAVNSTLLAMLLLTPSLTTRVAVQRPAVPARNVGHGELPASSVALLPGGREIRLQAWASVPPSGSVLAAPSSCTVAPINTLCAPPARAVGKAWVAGGVTVPPPAGALPSWPPQPAARATAKQPRPASQRCVVVNLGVPGGA